MSIRPELPGETPYISFSFPDSNFSAERPRAHLTHEFLSMGQAEQRALAEAAFQAAEDEAMRVRWEQNVDRVHDTHNQDVLNGASATSSLGRKVLSRDIDWVGIRRDLNLDGPANPGMVPEINFGDGE